MTKTDPRSQNRRFTVGTFVTVIFGWLCVAFSVAASLFIAEVVDEFVPIYFWVCALFMLASFPLVGFAMGLVSSFFWQGSMPISQQKDAAIGLLLSFYLPIFLIPLAGIALTLLTFYPVSTCFTKALHFGASWWPNRGWRHLFGLTNEWERDQPEP